MNERKIDVFMDGRMVGTLAETIDRRVAFAYSDEWLENGFAISPFSLPVEQKVFVPTGRVFEGMWGVFADSLPDALVSCWLTGWPRPAWQSDFRGWALPSCDR